MRLAYIICHFKTSLKTCIPSLRTILNDALFYRISDMKLYKEKQSKIIKQRNRLQRHIKYVNIQSEIKEQTIKNCWGYKV